MSNKSTKEKALQIAKLIHDESEILFSKEEEKEIGIFCMSVVKNSDNELSASAAIGGSSNLLSEGLLYYMRTVDNFYETVKAAVENYEETKSKNNTGDSKTAPDKG